MTRANDEPDAVYGLVAKCAEVAPDRMSVTFKLRPEAKFADGSPLTADDVVFSFTRLKEKGKPELRARSARCGEGGGDRPAHRALHLQGRSHLAICRSSSPSCRCCRRPTTPKRPFDQTSLDQPLGSGPYEIGDFKTGTYVTFKRRPDYWAKDLPVNRGRFNFDELRYEYYRDRTLELEGLKAATFDLREEFTSLDWATATTSPPSRTAGSSALVLPDERPSGAQGFFINTRREQFKDKRVREALGSRLRFRVVEQEPVLQSLQAHAELLREFRHEGGGSASAGGSEAARAVPRQAAAGGVRRALLAAGDGWHRDAIATTCASASELLTAAGYGAEAGGKPLNVEILHLRGRASSASSSPTSTT